MLTVEGVTQRAGMTRSAFYHYYNSLDELVLELLLQFEGEVRAAVDPLLEGEYDAEEDFRHTLKLHLTTMFEVFDEHHKSVGAVAQAASGNREVFQRWQRRVVDYYIEKTTQFIEHQVALGRSRVTDPPRVANALILMNNAVGMDNMFSAAPDDAHKLAEVIAAIWNATIYA